ncbi:MAG: hypothetical protein ACPHJW_00380, partial [Planctomycetota bacterium]
SLVYTERAQEHIDRALELHQGSQQDIKEIKSEEIKTPVEQENSESTSQEENNQEENNQEEGFGLVHHLLCFINPFGTTSSVIAKNA